MGGELWLRFPVALRPHASFGVAGGFGRRERALGGETALAMSGINRRSDECTLPANLARAECQFDRKRARLRNAIRRRRRTNWGLGSVLLIAPPWPCRIRRPRPGPLGAGGTSGRSRWIVQIEDRAWQLPIIFSARIQNAREASPADTAAKSYKVPLMSPLPVASNGPGVAALLVRSPRALL